MSTVDLDGLKKEAGQAAAAEVRSGMRLGLGTGSTVAHFLTALAKRIQSGEVQDVVGVPTSVRTEEAARAQGIPLGRLEELAPLDLTVDGADEVSPELDLIKGLGGALLREKMIAQATTRFLIIADEGKSVERLGQRSPVPVEVIPFEWRSHLPFLAALGAVPILRRGDDGEPYVTDNGNLIIDCRFEGGIADPGDLETQLARRAGVVETGLFLGLAATAILATSAGIVTHHRQDRS